MVFAGVWTFQKGCDVLASAVKKLDGVELLHVGGLGDVPFPDHPRFVHHEPVPQWRLTEYYALAGAFVIGSRQDGFALVIAQALASGLPVVCTDRTGGADLAYTPALAQQIRVVPHGDADELASAIAETLARAADPSGIGSLKEEDRRHLSWQEYGRRYSEELVGIH